MIVIRYRNIEIANADLWAEAALAFVWFLNRRYSETDEEYWKKLDWFLDCARNATELGGRMNTRMGDYTLVVTS